MRNRLRIIAVLGLIITLLIPGCVLADTLQVQNRAAINQAIVYLHSVQNSDGGFPGSKGVGSSNMATSWVMMGLAAADEDVQSKAWVPAGRSVLDYLQNCPQPVSSTCDFARTLLSLKAVKQDAKYQGNDLQAKIASLQQSSGQYVQLSRGEKGFINAHIWSIMALASAGGQPANKNKAREWLAKRQNKDGGWGWCEGIGSDADDTAVALQALVLLGENPAKSSSIKKGLNYIKTCQREDGGFSTDTLAGNKSNASTDSWVIQGLLACGENPRAAKWSVKGRNPVTHLLSLQNKDGSFDWIPGVAATPVITTAYAVMALSGAALPVNHKYQTSNR